MKSEEPEDYQLGWRPFLGCHIDLSRRPLIPRDETEYWVEQAIEEIKKESKTGKQVLDLFAGSGCLGLAVLKHCPGVDVTFGEKEAKFCEQIKINLKLNPTDLERLPKGLSGDALVIQTDLFSNLRDKFDYILANPPYVAEAMQGRPYVAIKGSRVQSSVRDWEPAGALFAGADGLDLIRPFLAQAKNYLKPGGKIYLEFGYGQKGKIEKLLRANDYRHWQFRRDQFGRWRWVVIQ